MVQAGNHMISSCMDLWGIICIMSKLHLCSNLIF